MAQRWSVRKSMMVTLALAWFLSYADRVNMSVASIPMQAEFGWDETTKGLVMGSVFIGYIASQLVGGLLAARIGAKRLLGLAVIAFSLLTLLTPVAAQHSFAALIAARVALGVAEGFAVPATYAFIGRWSPAAERSRLLAIVVSGATIGAPGGLMLSGFIVESSGWPTAFYLFGVLGLIWAAYWFRLAQDEPNDHPHISEEEKTLLAQSSVDTCGPQAIPYRKIFTHPAVWAIIVNKFCAVWMVYVFLAWLPSYFSAVQGVSVAGSGLFAALPWIAMSLMLYVASGWSDGMIAGGRDIDTVRKRMQVLGLGGALLFLLLIPMAESTAVALLITCLAMGALAFCYSGADPSVMEVAPRHKAFVTGLVGTIGNLPGIIAIPLIGWLVDSTGSYSWAFISSALLNVVGIVVWLAYGTGRKVID
jgi:ACS family sodium-dependent inorganic phosphate cotransporter